MFYINCVKYLLHYMISSKSIWLGTCYRLSVYINHGFGRGPLLSPWPARQIRDVSGVGVSSISFRQGSLAVPRQDLSSRDHETLALYYCVNVCLL